MAKAMPRAMKKIMDGASFASCLGYAQELRWPPVKGAIAEANGSEATRGGRRPKWSHPVFVGLSL